MRRFDPPFGTVRAVLLLTLRIHIIRILHIIISIIILEILENHTILQRFELSLSFEDSRIRPGLDSFPTDFLQSSFFGNFGSGVRILGGPTDVEDFVVVEGLAGHGLFGELSVVFVEVGHECHASVLEDTDCAWPMSKVCEW